jgi:hypothetical protein
MNFHRLLFLLLAVRVALAAATSFGAETLTVPVTGQQSVEIPIDALRDPAQIEETAKWINLLEARIEAVERKRLDVESLYRKIPSRTSYCAERDLGLVADDAKFAKHNTATLNSALEAGWPGGEFKFGTGEVGPLLWPIHFAAKQFFFERQIRTANKCGGHLIGAGRAKPLGNGEFSKPHHIGGQCTQFIFLGSDPTKPLLLIRNTGFHLEAIQIYGRYKPGNIHTFDGEKSGVGIALEGRTQPPTGGAILRNFAVVDCEVGVQFLAGYWLEDGTWQPDENHADRSVFADGYILGGSIGVQSRNQQALGHVFDNMQIVVGDGGVTFDARRGGNWLVTNLLCGRTDFTLLRVSDFSPNTNRFDIHFQRDGFGRDAGQRITYFEFAGVAPRAWKRWECNFHEKIQGHQNAAGLVDLVRPGGLPIEALGDLWFHGLTAELAKRPGAIPTGSQWEESGPYRRLMPEANGAESIRPGEDTGAK